MINNSFSRNLFIDMYYLTKEKWSRGKTFLQRTLHIHNGYSKLKTFVSLKIILRYRFNNPKLNIKLSKKKKELSSVILC